jgi:hypothetical protein
MRLTADRLYPVSIIIKKEEFPIVVPLHISADEEIKREERSPLPSLRYPSTSSRSGPSSRLSSYRTRSPALRFSPIRRGDSLDSTYHPATPITSPTPLEQPIDWKPVRQHGAVTDTTIVPSTASLINLDQIREIAGRLFSENFRANYEAEHGIPFRVVTPEPSIPELKEEPTEEAPDQWEIGSNDEIPGLGNFE